MRAHGPSPGFTLLEILLVMAIIAVATLVAMAAFNGGMRGIQQRAAAREVAAQLRFTRAVAISSGRPQDFVIDPRSRSWNAANGRHGSLPGEGEVEFTGAREVQPEEGKGAVRFFPDGAATGGRIRLQASGGGWDVDVGWLTGEVRVSRIGDPR